MASGQEGGGLQRVGAEAHAVMPFVPLRRALQDGHGRARARLAHQDRDEAPLQGGIALDVPRELVMGGRAHAGELASGERGLQLVGGVLGPLAGGPGADQRVQLVDEDHHAPLGALHLFLDAQEPLAERATQLGPRDETGHVQPDHDALGP